MRRSIARSVLSVGACALLLSGCASTPVDDVHISVKRIALSLAFARKQPFALSLSKGPS